MKKRSGYLGGSSLIKSGSASYRYGFNGQEKSDEIKGTGNSYTAAFWEYDPRIGRRWNIDPELDTDLSSYHAFANNPIMYIDPDGRHQYRVNANGKITKVKTKDKFDEFFLFRDSDGDGKSTWEKVARFDKNDKGFIALASQFRSDGWGWNYTGSKRENYISGDALAGLIGVLSNSKLVVSLNHWSNSDGSSPAPSKSHKDGTVGDIRPVRSDRSGAPVLVSDKQFDKEANTLLIKNAMLFGWTSILSERHNGWITPGTTHYSKVRHNNHYHIQKYFPKIEISSTLTVNPGQSIPRPLIMLPDKPVRDNTNIPNRKPILTLRERILFQHI